MTRGIECRWNCDLAVRVCACYSDDTGGAHKKIFLVDKGGVAISEEIDEWVEDVDCLVYTLGNVRKKREGRDGENDLSGNPVPRPSRDN